MSGTPLEQAADERRFGGKAAGLCAAVRAGLRVPQGVALEVDLVERCAAAGEHARAVCRQVFEGLGGGRIAARSSAVGEDAADASFAGQHLTRLNVTSTDALLEAVVEIHASARSDSARAYRRRLGLDGPPRIAVVVQRLIAPDSAGVLFTRNPVSGADERVVEATWGLGEAVVAGLCEPDRWRMERGGGVIEQVVGDKDVAVRPSSRGGTEEVEVAQAQRRVPCLTEVQLRSLEALAARCEAHFPGGHDVEWAFVGDELYVLQRRAITR